MAVMVPLFCMSTSCYKAIIVFPAEGIKLVVIIFNRRHKYVMPVFLLIYVCSVNLYLSGKFWNAPHIIM
jgi:hypothetical protein